MSTILETVHKTLQAGHHLHPAGVHGNTSCSDSVTNCRAMRGGPAQLGVNESHDRRKTWQRH